MHGWPCPSPPPSTSRRRRPHHRAPRHRAARALFRDPHPTHRDDGSMGPSTDISRSRTAPNNVGNTGPHSAGSHTESRPQWPADGRTPPTPWMGVRGVRSVRGLPTERKLVDLAKHGGDSGGFGLRLDGVEPLVGIVAAEGRQTGFEMPARAFPPIRSILIFLAPPNAYPVTVRPRAEPDDPVAAAVQAICDRLGPSDIDALPRKWLARLPASVHRGRSGRRPSPRPVDPIGRVLPDPDARHTDLGSDLPRAGHPRQPRHRPPRSGQSRLRPPVRSAAALARHRDGSRPG